VDIRERIAYLKSKLHEEGCTREELKELYFLLFQHGSKEELAEILKKEWDSDAVSPLLDGEASASLLANIKNKIHIASPKKIQLGYQYFSKIAASILLLGAVVWGAYHYVRNQEEAINIRYITKSTNKRQRATVTLSDGSVVMLNAESSITYPEVFAATSREIKLTGEAFFEVVRDPDKPFTVESGGLLTTVLGTSFNIRTAPDRQTEVTVATGKVKISPDNKYNNKERATELEKILLPKQQAKFDPEAYSIQISEVDLTKYLIWKEQDLNFELVPFPEVIQMLERWYHVKIILQNHASDHCLVRAKYQNESLPNVLDGLQLLIDFDYKTIDEGQILITAKGCVEQ
jgi:transmembrane sensor